MEGWLLLYIGWCFCSSLRLLIQGSIAFYNIHLWLFLYNDGHVHVTPIWFFSKGSQSRENRVHTVKSTVRRMNTPVLISFSTWVHTIFSCLWTVLLFLTWLYTRFWLYVLQKHPYCEKHSLSLQTRPAIRFATIYERLSLTYESRMSILSSTLNRIESRRFISEKISEELDI